jgi:hypothetical protein
MKYSNQTQRSGEDFAAKLKGTLKKRKHKIRPPPKGPVKGNDCF